MQARLPRARVLIIASGVPQEALRARTRPCAFQFIEKPFELVELEAAVKNLTFRGDRTADNPSLGTLRDLNLADLIPLQCLGGETSTLRVHTNGKTRGEIHFARGKIVHATAGRLEGIDALEQMLSWSATRFAVLPPQDGVPKRIRAPWHSVLLDVLQSMPGRVELSAPETPAVLAPTTTVLASKIVVIDDTEMLRVFVEEMLTTTNPNFEIVTAVNAAEGLRCIAASIPELVLLDYSLPDFNGDEVCRRLLEKEETARIPVIMMSGHVAEMTAAAARFPNIIATLSKPFLSSELIEVVTQTLEHPPEFKPLITAAPPALPVAPTQTADPPPSMPPQHNGQGDSTAPVFIAAPPPSPPKEPPQTLDIPPSPSSTLVAPPLVAPLPRPRAPVAPPQATPPLEPARIAAVPSNAVIVGMLVEVISMQFSPALQMAAIRARPSSRTVSLHIDPSAPSAGTIPEAAFELGGVELDARGQIRTMRLVPGAGRTAPVAARNDIPIGAVAVLPSNGGSAMQLSPAPTALMKIELLAAFELGGVELSPTFSVACLVLTARPEPVRVSLQPGAAQTGATFETAQVLLDRSGRIAEILLDAVA